MQALDWTSFKDRPNPGASAFGLGLLPGFSPVSVYDPLKPYEVADCNKGPLVLEMEDGPGRWPLDARRVSPRMLASGLSEAVRYATLCRTHKRQSDPIYWYTTPVEHNAFAWPGVYPGTSRALRRANRLLAPVFDLVDGVVVDAHVFGEIPFPAWALSVEARYELAAEASGKPCGFTVDLRFHAASADPSLRGKPLPAKEARDRLGFLVALRPAFIGLMGGYTEGPFTRLEMSADPNLTEATRVLLAPAGA